jgi:hypothetical protein
MRRTCGSGRTPGLRRSGLHLVHSRNRTVDPRSNPIPPLGSFSSVFSVADAKGGRIAVELHVPAAVAAREGYARLWHRYPSRFCAELNHSIYFFCLVEKCIWYGAILFLVWFKILCRSELFHLLFGETQHYKFDSRF